MKTELDLTTRALREIAVADIYSAPDAEEAEIAREAWRALFEELTDTERMAFDFTTDTIPERMFLPLARLVAARIAPLFGKEANEPNALIRVRRAWFGDDRGGDAVSAVYF